MTNLFRFNASLQGTWKQTLATVLQILRRVTFVIEDTFSWGDFVPTLSYTGGMTASGVVINAARYLKIFNFAWFHFDINLTLVAPLSNTITVTLPVTTSLNSGFQVAFVQVNNAVLSEASYSNIAAGASDLLIYRPAAVNYTAVASRLICSGCLEVI
jgi:hypothetical protein